MGDGVLALVAALGVNGHLEAIALIAAYIADDGALGAVEAPPDEGAVGALGGLLKELTREMRLRLGALGHDEQPTRILVDAVHEPQAWVLGVVVRVVLEVIGQGVDERPRIYARGRVHDHAARLVDDDNVHILIEDIQRDVLCTDLNRLCRRDGTRYDLAATQLKIRLAPLSVHRYVSLCDEALCVAAREGRQLPHEEYIQPFPCLIGNKCAHGRNSFFCTKSAQRTQIVPTTMAMSAILNTGHTRKSMKSMTCAKRIRSAMLLSAPAAKATLP